MEEILFTIGGIVAFTLGVMLLIGLGIAVDEPKSGYGDNKKW